MKLLGILVYASIISIVAALRFSSPYHLQQRALEQHLVHRHAGIQPGLASRRPRLLRKRNKRDKDCSGRKKKAHNNSGSSGSKSSGKSGSVSSSSSNNQSSGKTHTTKSSGKTGSGSSSKDAPAAESTNSTSNTGLAGKTFSGQCKKPNVSGESPNGDIQFLNCGISKSDKSSKWTPPDLQMKDITTISSEQAAKASVFQPCSKYHSDFEKAEQSTGIPVVMLMSFAMQESTCNPHETGGNGERGMMQLTPDKCKGVDCYDSGTNIMLGAKYFKSQVDQFNGNVLEAVGAYNGWSTGMSYSSATNFQSGPCAQNNLDYLNAFFNGWIMGKDGYSKQFVVYNNLANCSG